MARSLGLDIGNRRIGVAISDTLKVIARPVEVVDRKQSDAIKRIVTVVREQQVDEIVIGYPWNTDGTVGAQARIVEHFTELLRKQTGVRIVYCDERYSTGEAREIIDTKKRKDQTQHDDAIAAAIILQRYLDEHREQMEPDSPLDGGLYF
jgi:putative holliday junction resolvase